MLLYLKGKDMKKPQQCNFKTFAISIGDKKWIIKGESASTSVLHAPTNRLYLGFDNL